MKTQTRKTPRKGSIWHYRPAPFSFDQIDPTFSLPFDSLVRVCQPHGCPKNGTMGHVYVEDFDSGEFLGLVQISSLAK